MSNESVPGQIPSPVSEAVPRGRSTIEFPYLDLDNSVEIVKTVHEVEGDRCDWRQLATKLEVAPEGGGFRMRMLTAKTYGLVTYERGQIMLTELGIRMADPAHEKRARFDAFLAVPLFKQLFDRLNGQPLPPVAAIERMVENLGVAPKQKDKARQVFQRAAKQAGLFDLSSDRLSMPPGLSQAARTPAPREELTLAQTNGQGRGSGVGDYHPFIQGLLAKLPKPEADWPVDARVKWLTTAANIFDLMYVDTAGMPGQAIKVSLWD